MPKMIVIHERLCLACKSCTIECAMAHTEAGSLAEAVRMEKPPTARVHVEPLEQRSVPLQCRHCQDAPCMLVCPTQAIHRANPDSPVLLDEKRCIGCLFCVQACPFGVIELARDGKAVVKCDLCLKRTEQGLEPACVSACPTGALAFEEVAEFVRQKRHEAARQLASAGGDAEKSRE